VQPDSARRDQGVADRLRRIDDRRTDYMRSLFRGISHDHEDAEAHCLEAYALFIGGRFITMVHGTFTLAGSCAEL
jgi:hypothetical protein